jgi:hypothetical protein
MARPVRGTGFASHTKTLTERASSRSQLSPFPTIGKGFGKRFEAPSYEEGVGVDGKSQGETLLKRKFEGFSLQKKCRAKPCRRKEI